MNMENTNGDTCDVKIKRSRGGQPGNQNARVHGFYSRMLDKEEQKDYDEALNQMGLDQEIALLRTKIMSILRRDKDNTDLIIKAMGMLSRLLITRYQIGKDDKDGLEKVISNVLQGMAVPLGIGVSNFFAK
jgi:hypothetical protein